MKNKNIKIIGVLTSGGDAPGMNAAIRAVVRTAINKGFKVKGIKRGFAGLLQEEIIEMDSVSVADILDKGGTILYTARSEDFMEENGQEKAAKICEKHEIDALVVIGGDGSLNGARMLSNYGVSIVIVGLFLWDWIANKRKITETLEEMKISNSNTAKSLELLQKSMENQEQTLAEIKNNIEKR